MPVDRCRHMKLINNFNMETLRLFRAVTLLSIGSSKSRDLYCSAEHGDGRLAREQFNGFWFARRFRRGSAQYAYR